MKKTGIVRAVERLGSCEKLAVQIGHVTRQAVRLWYLAGVVPPERVLDVERASGVHRHHLNAVIYPDKGPQTYPEAQELA